MFKIRSLWIFFVIYIYIYIYISIYWQTVHPVLIRYPCNLSSGALITFLLLQPRRVAQSFDVLLDIRWTEAADWAPHRFTGWLRPLLHCDLPPSDPTWQRREPFKDSNCGEQTLDALCRAPPAGLGTASTLLAPMLPRSIEVFCGWKTGRGRAMAQGKLKREMCNIFCLWFCSL